MYKVDSERKFLLRRHSFITPPSLMDANTIYLGLFSLIVLPAFMYMMMELLITYGESENGHPRSKYGSM